MHQAIEMHEPFDWEMRRDKQAKKNFLIDYDERFTYRPKNINRVACILHKLYKGR